VFNSTDIELPISSDKIDETKMLKFRLSWLYCMYYLSSCFKKS